MTKTLFLLICLIIVLARTSYGGLLGNYFRNDERVRRVDCRRGDERGYDAVGPPQYYLSLNPTKERLAYSQNPENKYRRVSFLPRHLIGNSLLPFNLPLCSDNSLEPVALEGKKQQLYVDTDLQLYMADKNGQNSDYQEVLLHYNPNNKSVYVSICNHFPIQALCLKNGQNGAELSTDCSNEYSLERVVEPVN